MCAVALASMAVLTATAQGGVGVESRKESTLPLLVQRIIERERRLRAISAVYSEIGADGSQLSAGLRRHVAAMCEGSMFFRDNAHRSGAIAWQDDALRKLTYLDSERLVFYRPSDRSIFLHRRSGSAELPDTVRNEFLFHALLWWPFDKKWTPQVNGVPWTVEAVFGLHHCVVRSEVETREGRSVTPVDVTDVGTFWIAPDLEAIIGWVIRDPTSGYAVEKVDLGGWRRYPESFWVPTTIANVQYDFRATTAELRGRTVTASHFRIDELKVNQDIDQSVFAFTVPAGAVRMEETAGKVKVVEVYPDEREYADRLVQWMVRIGFLENKESGFVRMIIVGIGGGAVGLFGTVLARRLCCSRSS